MRKFLSILLCLSFLVFPVFGETPTLTLSSAEEFLAFAENCRLDSYSEGLSVQLTADIELKDTDFRGIPIFCGSFDGGGHTVSVSITADGSNLGFFRYIAESATVQDLSVSATVTPGGTASNIGGIVGVNAGTIMNCHFSGEIAGADYVGGIAGNNTLSGIIENCSALGTVYGNHFVGGIAGNNSGVIRSCSNQSLVNTTEKQNQVDISNITIDVLTGAESAMTVTDIGGIAGSSSGVIRDCENAANIGYPHIGYNIGGIAGSQSGFLTECTNRSAIHGRKDVGGIVGQLEPNTSLRFQEDTLQILSGQLEALGVLANKAKNNTNRNSTALTEQLESLDDHVSDAKSALEQLQPKPGTTPDPDSILAAGNNLGSSLQQIGGSLGNISNQAQAGTQTLVNDLNAISKQIENISQTLKQGEENLNTDIADISDGDTEEDTTAKLSACINWGAIQGDWNIGGIAGIIGFENDLDPESDLNISGQLSLNHNWDIRAVIRNCQSSGGITGKKQNTGGIVGSMLLGLVRDCTASGSITAQDGEYTGGITGRATGGFIRCCYVKAAITGTFCTGGIAGAAPEITDCRSMAQITGWESVGAILGYGEDRSRISNNYYLPVSADPGAIDGISYTGCATALSTEEFLALEGLPALFETNTVTFCFPDGTQEARNLPVGDQLADTDIPSLQTADGAMGIWIGRNGATLENIVFDSIFDASYADYPVTLASSDLRENGLPLLLAQGKFPTGSQLSLRSIDIDVRMERCLEAWQLVLPEGTTGLRYQLPADIAADKVLVRLQDVTGSWREVPFTADGSYLVFSAQDSDTGMQLILRPYNYTTLILLLIGILVVAGTLCTVLLIRRKKKK